MQTIQVMWPKKFGQRIVTIDEADFDPAIHGLAGDTVSITVDADPPAIAEPEPVVEEVVEPPAEPEKPTRRRK